MKSLTSRVRASTILARSYERLAFFETKQKRENVEIFVIKKMSKKIFQNRNKLNITYTG